MPKSIGLWEAEELAAAVLGLTEEQFETMVDEGCEDQLEDLLYGKFDVSLDQFERIASALLPFTQPIEQAMSKDYAHCFAHHQVVAEGEQLYINSRIITRTPFDMTPTVVKPAAPETLKDSQGEDSQ